MSKIFISYRRQDSRDVTGRIYDRLLRHWDTERIFKDVDNIAPGEDYRDVIDREIADCTLLLAVIGPTWVQAAKADGKRRLDDPHDMVRIEIESAFRQERRVIPVVVGEAKMPESEELPESIKELADRHAFPVRPDPDFHRDMDRLVQLIERVMTAREPLLAELIDPPAEQPVPPPVLLGQFLAAPQPNVGYDSSPSHPNPYAAPSGSYSQSYLLGSVRLDGAVTPAAIALAAVCGSMLAFSTLMLIGAFASISNSGGPDSMDAFMGTACVVAALGNVLGIGAAGCMFWRKLYWPAVIGVGTMALCTLVMCPLINLPAAAWAMFVLLQPGVREAFDSPA